MPVHVTETAAREIDAIIDQQGLDREKIRLRVGVKARGCSGMSYFVEYASEKKLFEEVVEDKGVTILIDPAATMFLIGSEMDYAEDKFQSGFTFKNPNEKARCGCGESFMV